MNLSFFKFVIRVKIKLVVLEQNKTKKNEEVFLCFCKLSFHANTKKSVFVLFI